MRSQAHDGHRRLVIVVVLCLAAGVAGHQARGDAAAGPRSQPAAQPIAANAARAGTIVVTPVEGPSVLRHLGLTIEHTSMGWEGQWGEPSLNVASSPTSPARPGQAGNPAAGLVLTGADLYRVSCRACHKQDGSGGPPEINSIIGPVQSASVQWMTQRMKAMGRPADAKFIRELTSGTEADLRKRLKVGGHTMPSFAHLSEQEIQVLRPYLDEMAAVPGAGHRSRTITEPSARVGELIVKGTCHICHDATGPVDNADKPTTVMSGIIPSLATIPHQKTLGQFVQKVREGSPIPLSAGGVSSRGRMAVFNYLSDAEAASAYSYLITYPPR
jgi:mono/diheme cytochrome c family protein